MFDLFAPGKPTPDGADMTVNLTFGFDPTAFKFTVNNAVFEPPTVPVLLQILSGAHNPHDLLPAGGVITVPRNKVIQINIPSGLIGGPHTFHMHGVSPLLTRFCRFGNADESGIASLQRREECRYRSFQFLESRRTRCRKYGRD